MKFHSEKIYKDERRGLKIRISEYKYLWTWQGKQISGSDKYQHIRNQKN